MGTGIILCGLNGVGKSTLGKALAAELNFHFIDNEELFFPKTDAAYIYRHSRTCEEVEKLLLHEIKAHENFVFTAVKGDYGEKILPYYTYAVLIEVPRNIRLQRVENRSFEKFGDRILPGGDLYEQEKRFFDMVKSRKEDEAAQWVRSLGCPVIRIDGTRAVEENVRVIRERMREW